MNPTMNVTGEFVFFWYVIAPTLILAFIFALSLSRELVRRLHEGWKRLRDTWHLRLSRRFHGSPAPGTSGR